MKHIAIALLLTASPAAAETQHAVYGVGGEKCQDALSHDWLAGGEVAWVAGFMTASSMAAAKRDIFPNHPTKELIGIVHQQCENLPSATLNDATESIMWGLWDAQQPPPKGEKF